MRIISGSFKGKKILEPKNQVTRPLKDLTKESIFNIIIHTKKFNIELSNSKVLDLFSGVGSFGLECLSRGSSNLIFVESYKEVLPVLKRKIPFRSFEIINQNEQSLGELFCFFILETILIGRALKINPYDQPSVELIKKETHKILI